jgi:hypothetical protein
MVLEMVRIMIFKVATMLSRLDTLMICTQDLIILNKTKEMIRYYESFGYDGKIILKHTFISF